jgi:hypothetical protein
MCSHLRNGCGVPNYGHHVPMAAYLGTQNAEAVFGIVVGDALDAMLRMSWKSFRSGSGDRAEIPSITH